MYLRLRSTAISCPPTKYLASPYVGVAERLFDSTVETVFVIQKSFSDDVALCVHDLREFRLGQFEGVNEIRSSCGGGRWNGRNSFRFRQNRAPNRSQIFVSFSNGYRQSEVDIMRSEEHTSELQSRGHLVCRLLLEKKKKTVRIFTNENVLSMTS